MTAAGGTGRGRGRPVGSYAFDTDARAVFLQALTGGAKLHEAATKAGVSRNVPAQHAKVDAEFREAMAKAKESGRATRARTKPHSETHYNHDHCPAPACRRIATEARAARRHTTADTDEEEPTVTAQPIPLPAAGGESPHSFLLARAS